MGPLGPKGDKGNTDDKGDKGDVLATIDYGQMVKSFVNQSDNLASLSQSLVNQGSALLSGVASNVVSNNTFSQDVRQQLSDDINFRNNLASTLTSDKYAPFLKGSQGSQGPPGSIGDYASLKTNLFSIKLPGATSGATMWCADGEICNLPAKTIGIQLNQDWSIYNTTSGNLWFATDLALQNAPSEQKSSWYAYLNTNGNLYTKGDILPRGNIGMLYGNSINITDVTTATKLISTEWINSGDQVNFYVPGFWGSTNPQMTMRNGVVKIEAENGLKIKDRTIYQDKNGSLRIAKTGWGDVATFNADWNRNILEMYRDDGNTPDNTSDLTKIKHYFITRDINAGRLWP